MKHYNLRKDDVHRLYGNAYSEYKSSKTHSETTSSTVPVDCPIQPFKPAELPSSTVDPIKPAELPSIKPELPSLRKELPTSPFSSEYEEPRFITDTYILMRRPKKKALSPRPAPRNHLSNLAVLKPTAAAAISSTDISSSATAINSSDISSSAISGSAISSSAISSSAISSSTSITSSSSVHQSAYSEKYNSKYIGGVKSEYIGGSSDSYARLEARLAKLN